MPKRKIIEIDREQCNGCGECTTACAEGALELDEKGKAVLVREIYCDGLGACLDVCPTGALNIIEKDSAAYDAEETYKHVLSTRGNEAAGNVHDASSQPQSFDCSSGCPGSHAFSTDKAPESAADSQPAESELTQWPIQLHLVSPAAPCFENSRLLIAADCTAFSMGGFHSRLLKGKTLIIACPKLDDSRNYVEKLTQLLQNHNIQSLTVATMVVPCCSGLEIMVQEAVNNSGKQIPVEKIKVGIKGEIKKMS